ncbi:MAG TPA: S46 family peptidase [Fimbriiglobus sp.]
MRSRTRIAAAALAVTGLTMTTQPIQGDEGMWLFNNPPLKLLKEKYGFEPTPQWLEHVQKSSVRFNSGGSGSFISANGLVMTNHHVGASDLQKFSSEKHNYLRDGFHARTLDQEKPCEALELNVLQSIQDVTAEVNAAVKPGMAAGDAYKARVAKIAEIEKAATDKPNNIRADVVTLYAGGVYNLYTYKRYTDIRLVFAPEKQSAFYGGDPDNFEYPRYDLDICFFRVYEHGKPIHCENYLKWSPNGCAENELTFVSGHPGRTNRQQTMAELEFLRDTGFPFVMQRLFRLEVLIGSWAERSASNRQKCEEELFGIQNSRKARIGGLQGLLDPKIMARKKAEEDRLKIYVNQAKSIEAQAARGAFDTIAAAEKKQAEIYKEYVLLEGTGRGLAPPGGFVSSYFAIARALVRAADEKAKPAGDRLPEFGDARLPSLEQQLFSEEPFYDDYEMLKLADSLTLLATTFGGDNEMVQKILAGKSPRERAYELIGGTKVKDVATRKKLYEGGKAAVDASTDPMIAFARLVDPYARKIRKVNESEVEEPKRQAYAALARARFALDGTNTYPDATFTLRLSYGTVKGYREDGKTVPAFTHMGGLYKRSMEQGNKGPFELPARWEQKKASIDLNTPFNFVSTADIIGGNSGSPVINKKGEVVGIIFDGNIQSLVLDFCYEDEVARAVSVDSRAIIEGLRKVYDAADLADEIQGKK